MAGAHLQAVHPLEQASSTEFAQIAFNMFGRFRWYPLRMCPMLSNILSTWICACVSSVHTFMNHHESMDMPFVSFGCITGMEAMSTVQPATWHSYCGMPSCAAVPTSKVGKSVTLRANFVVGR